MTYLTMWCFAHTTIDCNKSGQFQLSLWMSGRNRSVSICWSLHSNDLSIQQILGNSPVRVLQLDFLCVKMIHKDFQSIQRATHIGFSHHFDRWKSCHRPETAECIGPEIYRIFFAAWLDWKDSEHIIAVTLLECLSCDFESWSREAFPDAK
jgi:hypothetical protein